MPVKDLALRTAVIATSGLLLLKKLMCGNLIEVPYNTKKNPANDTLQSPRQSYADRSIESSQDLKGRTIAALPLDEFIVFPSFVQGNGLKTYYSGLFLFSFRRILIPVALEALVPRIERSMASTKIIIQGHRT